MSDLTKGLEEVSMEAIKVAVEKPAKPGIVALVVSGAVVVGSLAVIGGIEMVKKVAKKVKENPPKKLIKLNISKDPGVVSDEELVNAPTE